MIECKLTVNEVECTHNTTKVTGEGAPSLGGPSPVTLVVLCVHSPAHSLSIYTLSPDSPLCPTLYHYINHSFLSPDSFLH